MLTIQEKMDIDMLWEHIENGGIVSNGAYTLGKDKYFAFGTYPGCIRGGWVTKESLTKGDFKVVTEKEIVERVGYAHDVYSKPYINDGSVNFNNLRDYLEKRLTVRDYVDPRKNSAVCREYFDLYM